MWSRTRLWTLSSPHLPAATPLVLNSPDDGRLGTTPVAYTDFWPATAPKPAIACQFQIGVATIPDDPRLDIARSCVSPVLVGREAELGLVSSAAGRAPSLVVIDGEAGIGKSRLVRELLNGTDVGGVRVLVGHCEHLQEPFPLGPLLDAFRHQADHIAGRLSPVAGALAPLVPEIADRLPPAPPVLDDQRAARHRVFRAAVELIDHLSPAVLVLEDVHWADAGTFDFLTFLVAHQPRDLSIIVTARSETGPLPISEAFARAPAGPPLSITLEPLDKVQVAELAENILQAEIPAAMAATLYDKTGGIPFVVEEVLRTLLEAMPVSEIAWHPGALNDIAVPTALRDVMLQRLGALDACSREILGVAAVVDATVDHDVLAEVSDYRPGDVAVALAEAHDAGLLQELDGQSRFRHVLAQQIVYEAVPAPSRRWLHRRAAELIERRGEPRPFARIAHHYQRAGVTTDFVHYAEQAADQATSHGDDATAARFLLQAMGVPDLSLDDRLRLAAKLGRAAVDGLAHSEAVPILERLLLTEGLPAHVRGELRFALGRLLRQQGMAQAGYREIERAVPDLEEQPALLAKALAVLAAPETTVGRHIRDHAARCDQAEEAARRSGSADVELAVRIARASLLLEQGDPNGWKLIDEMRADGALTANPREHARAYVNWAQGALHVGHVRRADELLAEGRRIAAQAEYLRISEVIDLVAAATDRAAGRWDGLAERIRDLAFQPSMFAAASLDDQLLHGMMLAASGSADEAVRYLEELIAASERVGAVWPLIPARTVLARLLLTVDDTSGAVAQANAALQHVREKGNWVWGAETVLCLVDAYVAQGHGHLTEEIVGELAVNVAAVDAPLAQAALRTCQAIAARETGDAAAADPLQATACEILHGAGLKYEEARASERLGGWRCDASVAGGAEMLERALRIYGDLRAKRDIARVCRTMRGYGVPVPYPWRGGRRSHGLELSSREREVADLAASGRTNREIAADLYLSPRTVESHISNALRKLGCQSRAELSVHPALTDPEPS